MDKIQKSNIFDDVTRIGCYPLVELTGHLQNRSLLLLDGKPLENNILLVRSHCSGYTFLEVILDKAGRMYIINRLFAEHYGYPLGTISQRLPDDDPFLQRVQDLFNQSVYGMNLCCHQCGKDLRLLHENDSDIVLRVSLKDKTQTYAEKTAPQVKQELKEKSKAKNAYYELIDHRPTQTLVLSVRAHHSGCYKLRLLQKRALRDFFRNLPKEIATEAKRIRRNLGPTNVLNGWYELTLDGGYKLAITVLTNEKVCLLHPETMLFPDEDIELRYLELFGHECQGFSVRYGWPGEWVTPFVREYLAVAAACATTEQKTNI